MSSFPLDFETTKVVYKLEGTQKMIFLKFVAIKIAVLCSKVPFYARSPRIRRASWMSFGIMVTRLAWIAHKFVSSKRPTKYASDAS